ncbi:HXXEE domain-containing protein [Ancylobacter sp. WKF20]|uniref:HXXEE domain-containing protein n=1 Tax=Ancylobacter sp. WKF20 TaxID=3039801 RepID=UPI00243424BE|nr:HXXEE domain-containing protein [Ancylobacter sp. WKF20]WGD30666.1 HXXEE domain-containing protein [Ancylobacter sp. WKF20]
MPRLTGFTSWLAARWVVAAAFMAGALLALVPVLHAAFALPLLLIFLHSPGYMIHQVEEHTGDRFRRFANSIVFGGREGLTVLNVLVINVGAVWGLNLAALYAAAFVGPGYGLIAPYAMLVNALTHLGAAARLKRYNPGLVTSLVLFLPLSLVTLTVIGRDPGTTLAQHGWGLAGALILHALIIASVALRLRRLPG